jgi:hypothetical protein
MRPLRGFGFGLMVIGWLSLIGCSSPSQEAREIALVKDLPINAQWSAAALPDGKIAVAYYDGDRNLKVQSSQELLFDSRAEYPGGSLSGLALASSGDRLWWAFRPKEPNREVAIRSNHGARLSIDGTSLPLPRIALVPDRTGGLEVYWTGERPLSGAASPESWIGRAVFDASGARTSIEDALPGELPSVAPLPDGKRVLVANHDYGAGGKVSAWLGGGAGAPVVTEIASGVAAVQPTGAMAAGGRVFAYWNNESGRQDGEFELQLAYSDDGRQWPRSSLVWNKKDYYPNEIRLASDGGANLIAAVNTGVKREDGKRSNRIKLYRSFDGGANWQGPFEVRASAFDYAKEEAAAVKLLSTGQFLVVWTDWRFTRPSLRYSLYPPNKTEAVIQDAPLARPADSVGELPFLLGNELPLFEDKGVLRLVAERPNDGFTTKSLHVVERDVASLRVALSEPRAPDMARLEKRVNEFGKAYLEKRYKDAYGFFDPFYRARVSPEEFLKTQGRIDYRTYEFVERVGVQGVAANVKVRIVASVPPFTTGSQARFEGQEAREMESVGRWLWIDGDWYREYFSQALEKGYTQYY